METTMRYTRCKCARKPLESDDSTGLNNWTSQSLPAGLQVLSGQRSGLAAVTGVLTAGQRTALCSRQGIAIYTCDGKQYTSIGLAGQASCMNVPPIYLLLLVLLLMAVRSTAVIMTGVAHTMISSEL